MASTPDRVKSQVAGLLGRLSPRQRLTLGAAGVSVLAAFGWLIWRGQPVTLQPLFTNLAPEDAASIVEELKSARVPYDVGAGGTIVMAPAERVHALRLELAGKGLPRGGGVGFEIFDQKTFGLSEFAQQLNYRRALMGELQRTIGQIDAVEGARVHIVVPKPSLYAEREEAARASVTLRLRAGRRLGPGQVDAIVHLVAASVEGLAPENVTVVDTTGAMLSRGDDAGTATAALDYQRRVEDGMEKRVGALLDRALGEGKAVVQVSADVDFSQVEKTAETFDPDGTVVRSEQSSEEKAGGQARSVGGAVDARVNLTGVAAAGATPAPGPSGSRRIETRNYEVSKTTSREVVPSGKLRRLSVAVLLDEAGPAGAGGKAGKPIGADEVARLEGLVKRAVGFDERRGDQVQIAAVKFAPPPPVEDVPKGPGVLARATSLVPHLVALLGLAVVLVLLLILRRRPAIEPVIALPRTVRELEANLQAAAQAAAPAPAANTGRLVAARAAEEDQGRAAAVLRGWLSEG